MLSDGTGVHTWVGQTEGRLVLGSKRDQPRLNRRSEEGISSARCCSSSETVRAICPLGSLRMVLSLGSPWWGRASVLLATSSSAALQPISLEIQHTFIQLAFCSAAERPFPAVLKARWGSGGDFELLCQTQTAESQGQSGLSFVRLLPRAKQLSFLPFPPWGLFHLQAAEEGGDPSADIYLPSAWHGDRSQHLCVPLQCAEMLTLTQSPRTPSAARLAVSASRSPGPSVTPSPAPPALKTPQSMQPKPAKGQRDPSPPFPPSI